MADPILDEIWRVREQLVKDHGGIHAYVKYIQKIERLKRQRRRKPIRSRKRPMKTD